MSLSCSGHLQQAFSGFFSRQILMQISNHLQPGQQASSMSGFMAGSSGDSIPSSSLCPIRRPVRDRTRASKREGFADVQSVSPQCGQAAQSTSLPETRRTGCGRSFPADGSGIRSPEGCGLTLSDAAASPETSAWISIIRRTKPGLYPFPRKFCRHRRWCGRRRTGEPFRVQAGAETGSQVIPQISFHSGSEAGKTLPARLHYGSEAGIPGLFSKHILCRQKFRKRTGCRGWFTRKMHRKGRRGVWPLRSAARR